MLHGGDVWQGASPKMWLDFSANLRPEGPPAWTLNAMQEAVWEARYYPDLKMRAARHGLAAYAGVDELCILPTAGGIAAIDLACSLSSGRVCIQPPTFGEYARRAEAHGRTVVESPDVNLRPGDTVFLCNPNNPTGFAHSREQVLALADRARRAGATLVVDEAFIDYCPECSVRDRAARDENLLVTGSLTKSLCVPGARLGYLIGRPEPIAWLEETMEPWSLNAMAASIARALPAHHSELRADCRRNADRREALRTGLCALGAKVLPSQANFLLADFGWDMTRVASVLRDDHILVRLCDSFGLGKGFVRFAIKREAENRRLLDALEKALR